MLRRAPSQSRVGPYELETRLGDGHFGHVSKAIHSVTREVVAIKKLFSSNGSVDRRKLSPLKTLTHPNLVQPENLLLTVDHHVKISDFGLGMFLDTPHTNFSPLYTAPEVSGFPADIWSLGVLLFSLVTGRLPWNTTDSTELYSQIDMVLRSDIVIPDNLSESCRNMLSRLLDRNPATRITIPEIRAHEWTIAASTPIRSSGEISQELEELRALTSRSAIPIRRQRSHSRGATPVLEHLDNAPRRRSQSDVAEPAEEVLLKQPTHSHGGKLEPIPEDDEEEEDEETHAAPPLTEFQLPPGLIGFGSPNSYLVPSTRTQPQPTIATAPVARRPPKEPLPLKSSTDRIQRKEDEDLAITNRAHRTYSALSASSAKPAPAKPSGLRVLKGIFNCETSTTLPAERVRESVAAALESLRFPHQFERPFQAICMYKDCKFEVEICEISGLSLRGVRLKRLSGDTWIFKEASSMLVATLKL